MYILNGNRKEIVNSEFVQRFCIADKGDAALIVASYSTECPPVTLARYESVAEAKEVLGDFFGAIAGGQSYYTMPESRMYAQDIIKKDARTKWKGSS